MEREEKGAMSFPAETLAKTIEVDDEQEKSFCFASQMAMSSVLPMVMQTAIELGIFDIIAKAGPDARLSALDIAAQMPTNNPDSPLMLDRILRLLTSFSVLSCSLESDLQGVHRRLYSMVPVSKYFLSDEDGGSLGPLLVLVQDRVFMQCWPLLKDAVLEGGLAFNMVHGTHAFDYPRGDPRFSQIFNTAMLSHTTIVMRKLLETYKGFEQIKQLVDVGGGLGVALSKITSKYPHIKGLNFDLPGVIQHAPSYPGVEHIEGDMFESVPGGDAIFLKNILHDWSDDHCLNLLKNCHRATPDDGKIIVVDQILPTTPENGSAARTIFLLDVFMMTQCPGGQERSQQEFMSLAKGSGFSGIRFECCVCNLWVMELYK